ncbi:MAG: 2-C-methyl-D-erythritol 4-phosphate cytidylyltransferase [Candidatus Cloacimonadaceae bacterium]|nr:2-C-methyl-D-erythritol 4-phosphate cytidylyltransferase [Candidatus Cloacimonadaceae bacterium]
MDIMTNNVAIITAAGFGTRLLGEKKKQFRELAGIPIIIRTLAFFVNSPYINRIIVTAPEDEVQYCESLIHEYFEDIQKPYQVIAGGVERQDSVFGALQICPPDTDYVFIHDAVRPFISMSLIQDLYEAVVDFKAVVPCAPCKHTIKQIAGDVIESTLDRKKLIQAFTPQVFSYDLILSSYMQAYQQELFCTDDAQIVEKSGTSVSYMLSNDLNIKITNENDLVLARFIIEKNIVL